MLGLPTGITNTSYQWQPNFVGDSVLKMWLRNNVDVFAHRWGDSSGNDHNANQSDGSLQADISGGGLEFDGSSHHYDIEPIVCSAEEGFTITMVIDPDAVDNRTLLGIDSASEFVDIMSSKKIRIKIDGTARTLEYSGAQFVVGEKFVLTIVRKSGAHGELFVYKNGVKLTPTSSQANPGAISFSTLGSRGTDRFFDGHIYEALVYDREDVTDNDLVRIHNYLINKHNI